MIVKCVRVFVKSGRMSEYLAAQEVWNRETAGAAGYLGCFCGRPDDQTETVTLLLFWRTRPDLVRWMETEHDRIAELAGADRHYERIEVEILESVLPTDGPRF